jgi:hypothetical protein
MFARLNSELKLGGFTQLSLKGIGTTPELQLKGLSSQSDDSSGLKLKLGNEPQQAKGDDDCAGKSWGIPGLPGV